MRWFFLIALIGSVAGVSGCNSAPALVKVEGVVSFNGSPLEGAIVAFVPQGASGRPATGATKSDGSFHLETVTFGTGAFPGDYKVLITKVEAPATPATLPGPITEAPTTKEQAMALMKQYYKESTKKGKKKKSLIPSYYGNVSKTPFQFHVPTQGQVVLELKD